MDLSAVIFVVLAIGWAAYLIPKALQHHDELAGERLLEGHSDDVRVLPRPGRQVAATDEPISSPGSVDSSGSEAVTSAPIPTLAAARRAARNRRRVLGVLTLALAAVAGLAAFGLAPWWTVAIPGALIVAFLVVARISVRRAQQARRAAGQTVVATAESTALQAANPTAAEDVEHADDSNDTEDTIGVPRQELEAALADEGSLWDPLPVTLPTYVGKARARRTVRTIELTGINSSGHDETDSALAREAEANAAAHSVQAADAEAEAEQRRAAGA